MPTITIQLETPISRTFRVEQVAGMFDVPLEERLRHSLTAELPGLDEPWTIGAIVGPSGSGKTTLARAAFGDAVYQRQPWPDERAIIDCLGNPRGVGVPPAVEVYGRRDAYPTIKDLTRVLTAVGLGSGPTWLKPYQVLSTGEKFRVDLARGLLTSAERTPHLPPLVIDEFTSTLDRTVAKTASAALARFLRREGSLSRFIALTCHADILPWLQPDWVLGLGDPSGPRLMRGRLQLPPIALHVRRTPQKLWAHFAKHHYLAGGLAASATCYAAWWDMTLIAFCAVVAALGWKKTKRIARLVTLPEFQGLGIGSRLAETVSELEASRGNRVTITASHPAILAHCSHSPRWRFIGLKKTGSTRQRFENREVRCSAGRAVASFEFVGEE